MNTSYLTCKACNKDKEKDILNFREKKVSGKIYFEKTCRKCEAIKASEYYHNHKDERAEYQKQYIEVNKKIIKEKKKEYDKERYKENKEQILDNAKTWAKNNRNKINSNKRARRKNDPAYKLRYYVSSYIRNILNKNGFKKNNSSLKYLAYSFQELKNHLELLFAPWMTWDNWGVYDPDIWDDGNPSTWTWNVDHIIPQSDLIYISMDDENFKKCWALENLRPLSAKLNIIEGTNRVRHGK